MTLLAEPPLQADIMMSSSMMESLILGLPDWTTKTSFSRTLVKILTLVSPFERSELVICPEAGNQGKPKSSDAELQEAHIGELGQLRLSRSHAQVLTYLAGESWARIASENERVAHCGRPLKREKKKKSFGKRC